MDNINITKNNVIKLYSVRYNLPEEEVKILLPLTKKYNLHIYDMKIIYDKYGDKYEKHIEERRFPKKVERWLEGNYKIKNTQRFRKAAINYQKNGKYTNLIKNKHPNSKYMKYWKEEARRCIYGYLNDGEWVTGYHYFYLNYSPIILTKSINDVNAEDGQIQGERVTDFPFFWDGDFFYFHYIEEAERLGLSAAVLKTRGRGYSFKAASMMNRNFYLIPESKSIIYAGDDEYLSGGDGVLTKTWSQMAFLDSHTPWIKRKQKKDTDHYKRASFVKIVDGTEIEQGFLSEIIGKTLGNNTNKARGKRAKLILFEEAGSFKGLTETWIVNKASVMQGRITYGTRIAFGTGGDTTVGFDGLRKLFYSPEAYQIYSLPNFWTPGSQHKKVAWFQPEYINREGFYDKDGNSDIEAAKEDILLEREKLIASNADLDTILRSKAEQPIYPEEAILRLTASPFPRAMLKEQLIKIQNDPDLLGYTDKGRLIINSDGKVVWQEDNSVNIIETHNPSKLNREGGIEIYQHPIQAVKEQLYGYIIGVDPVDFDYNEINDDKYSLGSCFVMNTMTKQIVAEYTGRPDLAETFYENVRRLAIYYNATVMYENNIKGLYTYFVNKFSEHLLAYKPKILDDGNMLISTGRRKYGYTANERVNKMGLQLIKKWLTEPVNSDGDLLILHTIKSKGLLDELIEWNPDGNFDRVSSMIATLIFYKDVERMLDEGLTTVETDEASKFFRKPFKYK